MVAEEPPSRQTCERCGRAVRVNCHAARPLCTMLQYGLSGCSRKPRPAICTVGSFDEPAGLHRAAQSDSYAYVDSGASGAGTVFVVNPR